MDDLQVKHRYSSLDDYFLINPNISTLSTNSLIQRI